jgi:glutamate-5-semialdehyde dehydrogenase
MRSDKNNPAESLVKPVESTGVEEVAPIPIPEYVNELVMRAKSASGRLATLSTAVKNQALLAMAEALEEQKDTLLAANELDLEAFGTAPEKKAMRDRLRLTAEQIHSVTCRRCGPGQTGCRLGVCAFRSVSLALFMSPART